MRKFFRLQTDVPDGLTLPQNISLSTSLYSPTPSPYPRHRFFPNLISSESFFFLSFPVPDIAFDIATFSLIAGLLLLSLIAFIFIFRLHLRSRRTHHLQNFNALWTVRSLLVSFASLWAVNEILRLPFVRRELLDPFFPSITLEEQANICKLHVVLSLGFLEPGFLISLLFLVNVSIKKRKPHRIWSLVSVLTLCSPTIFLHIFFVYFPPMEGQLPKFIHGSHIVSTDPSGQEIVLCTYPFFSWVIFGGFTAAYTVAFLFSCWRVMAFVINKGIANRINVLAFTVMVALPVQILCISLSWMWTPEYVVYGWVVLAMFLCVGWCMAVGEVLLVLKPIRDSLAAGGDCCQWNPDAASRRPAEEREHSPGL